MWRIRGESGGGGTFVLGAGGQEQNRAFYSAAILSLLRTASKSSQLSNL